MVQESRLAIIIDSRSAEQRASDLKTVLDHLEQSGTKATVTLRGTGDSAKSVGDKSKGAAQSIGEMATALGSVVSVGKLWAQIEKATFAAGRYDQLGIIMEVVGRNAGHSAGELAQLQSELESTGISMEQSRQVITRLIQANIDLSQATRLARLAQDAATIGNISSSEALERLVVGVQTSQVEILRNIGIVTNFEAAYKNFAVQAGRTTASLSEQEKMQARVNAVMEQGPAIAGAYEASMENANKQMGSMARHADNLQVKLGEAYQPAFALAIEVMTDGLKLAGENAGTLSIGLAGVTAAAATATTGILALRAGAVALNVALNAMRAHPVIMALSVLTGVVAAVGVAFSGLKTDTDVGGSGLDDFGKKVDALRTKVNDLREAEAKWAINEITKMHKEAEGEVSKLGARVEWLQVQLSRHPSSKMVKEWNEQLTTAQKEFLGASDQAETYRQRLDDLQGQIAALKGEASSGNAAAGALETVDEFLKDVQKRMIAMDTGSSAVARANQLIFENASLTEEQRTAVLKAAQAEDILRESLKSRGSASTDVGKQYLTEIRERLALIGKETEYERLLAQVAAGALTFRTTKQMELAKAEAQRLDAAEKADELRKKEADLGKEAEKRLADLQREIDLAGAIGEADKTRYEVLKGLYVTLPQSVKDSLVTKAEELDMTKRQIEIEQVLADLRAQQSTTQIQFMRELSAFGQGDRVRELNADLAKVEDRYRSLIEARRNSAQGLSDSELAQIRESLERELSMVREYHDKKLEIAQDWRLGARDALINYADDAANVYESLGQTVSNAFKGMEDALVQFATKGKLDFKSLADSIISDMVRIAIQQNVTGPLSGLFGSMISAGLGSLGGGGVAGASLPGIGGTAGGLLDNIKFSSGGYTGDGGKYEPAGIVHRGEGVLNQDEIRGIGGEAGFNALRRALRTGHAFGGMGGRPSLPPAAFGGQQRREPSIVINSTVNAAPGTNAAELDAMLEQRNAELRYQILEDLRRGRVEV